jgi:beta-lactamase regulating signal transducer with metallopeptidase domain
MVNYFFSELVFANLAFIVPALLGLGLSWVARRVKRTSAVQTVKAHYFLFLGGAIGLCAASLFQEKSFEQPLPQVFDTQVLLARQVVTQFAAQPLIVAGGTPFDLKGIVAIALWAVVGFLFLRLFMQVWQARRIISASYVYKRVGRVRILVTDYTPIPFAFSGLIRSYVVMPSHLLENSSAWRIALMHEIQHIRARDTHMSLFLAFMKPFLLVNPLVMKWMQRIQVDQEYSCDESLIVHRAISPRSYAQCLLDVANHNSRPARLPIGATGILFDDSRNQLVRRVEKMKGSYKKLQTVPTMVLALATISLITCAAFTVNSYARNGMLTIDEVKRLVHAPGVQSGFPVSVNEQVVDQLNRLISTIKGRAYARAAFKNFHRTRAQVEGHLNRYGYPVELLAIPFIESKFLNLPPEKNPVRAAGMWQFIRSTARVYNLRVDADVDERMDVDKETDAAMRYLGAMKLKFQDWNLAVMAYNAGESRVQRGIDRTSSRDPWKIIQYGFENDRGYLAKFSAAAILMRFPELLN